MAIQTVIVNRNLNDPLTNVINPLAMTPYGAFSIPAYWRAMRFLSENLASFPRCVQKDGAKRAPDEKPHPLEPMLKRRPNGYQNATIFWRTWFFQSVHLGNGYAELERDAQTKPIAAHNLSWSEVIPFRYDSGDGRGMQQYYGVRGGGGETRIIPGADMLHLQGLGWDGMSGMDPIFLHADSFERASTQTRYMTKFLTKGTMIRGAVSIPLSATEEQVQQVLALIRTCVGPDADRDVLVLSDGATLSNVTITPQAAQFNEQEASITKSIAQITGVPPQFLYEFSESKYNNSIEQMGQDVVRYTFRPWIEQAEDELSLKLLSADEQAQGFSVHLNPDALLRGDTAAVNASAISTKTAGIRTTNESRKLIGLPPDPDPASDTLQTLGSTTPQPSAEAKTSQNGSKTGDSGANSAAGYAALKPVFDAICARVDSKTGKAFERMDAKTGQEKTIAVNLFAEDQHRYVMEALSPVSESLRALGCAPLDIDRIAARYAAAIKRRAAGGGAVGLAEIASAA